MILCAHSNKNHSSLCITMSFLNCSCFSGNGNGRESGLLFGINGNWNTVKDFPRPGKGMGMK